MVVVVVAVVVVMASVDDAIVVASVDAAIVVASVEASVEVVVGFSVVERETVTSASLSSGWDHSTNCRPFLQ